MIFGFYTIFATFIVLLLLDPVRFQVILIVVKTFFGIK